jgi:hypothetical protein
MPSFLNIDNVPEITLSPIHKDNPIERLRKEEDKPNYERDRIPQAQIDAVLEFYNRIEQKEEGFFTKVRTLLEFSAKTIKILIAIGRIINIIINFKRDKNMAKEPMNPDKITSLTGTVKTVVKILLAVFTMFKVDLTGIESYIVGGAVAIWIIADYIISFFANKPAKATE